MNPDKLTKILVNKLKSHFILFYGKNQQIVFLGSLNSQDFLIEVIMSAIINLDRIHFDKFSKLLEDKRAEIIKIIGD